MLIFTYFHVIIPLIFVFQTKDSKSFAFAVKFETADKLYGLFDHAYDIALPETADGSMDPFRLKNLDSSGYEVNSPMALYGSVPAVYGHSYVELCRIILIFSCYCLHQTKTLSYFKNHQ